MGKCRFAFVFVYAIILLLTGCLGDSDSNSVFPITANPPSEATTSVRFVISGQQTSGLIRAQTTTPPTVVFELRLLDRTSTSNPVIRLRKQAAVASVVDGYSASAVFENVPVLPAIGNMIISGGYLVGAGGLHFSNWAGKADLVAASANAITLVGAGDKSATDVSVNLLEQLIAAPANIPALATPIFAKIDAVVASLTLTSPTVYTDAVSAYTTAYGALPVPVIVEFNPPTNFTSLAFPKTDANVSLAMSFFNADSEAWVLLMNRSNSYLTANWSVPPTVVGSTRASTATEKVADEHPMTPEQKFHLALRNFKKPAAGSAAGRPAVNTSITPALRAVAVNDILSFKAYLTGSTTIGSVFAKCKHIVDFGGKKTYFFLDTADISLAGVDNVVTGMVDAWTLSPGIYNINRTIFGDEPTGTFTSANVNDISTDQATADLYILISRQIYTAGYFYAGDLYPSSVYADSNHKKIFYLQLDSDISDITRTVSNLSSTIAHEFQHMIHFWQKRTLPQADAWLEEAMSGYAEFINGFKIENGKNQSKALQANYYFSRVNQIRVDKWLLNTDSYEVASAHYGKAFLFGVWLAQNYGSNGSVQNLLAVPLTEKAAVAAFTGEPFDETFARFMLAMAVNDTAGGFFGFKGLDLLATYNFGTGWAPVTLTGPQKNVVSPAYAGGSASPVIAPYAAAYVRILNGNGNNVSVNATLPTGIALFQLRRN